MGVLKNAKHERFAQEIAKGTTATEAYILAGYAANDSNSARLNGNERIRARVAEILERAAAKVEISVASVTEALLRIAGKAEKLADASGLAVARASHMDAAKLNGLVIEKAQLDATIRDERELSDSDLAHIARTGGDRAAETPSGPH